MEGEFSKNKRVKEKDNAEEYLFIHLEIVH